jgi:hypothetical protein
MMNYRENLVDWDTAEGQALKAAPFVVERG